MLEEAFSELSANLEEVLSTSVSVTARLKSATEIWVDTVVSRPSLAVLIIRYVAEAGQHASKGIYPLSDNLRGKFWDLFHQGLASGELRPIHNDPLHAASAVIGHTLFYVSALSPLIFECDFKLFDARQIESHKIDVLNTLRRQLGIAKRRRVKGNPNTNSAIE